jgi:hypothetical protein
VALSQLRELGEQAVAAVAASLGDGGAVLKAQLIASRFYEALRHEIGGVLVEGRCQTSRADSSQ